MKLYIDYDYKTFKGKRERDDKLLRKNTLKSGGRLAIVQYFEFFNLISLFLKYRY